MDYSFCQAIAQTPTIPSVLLCYDVGCQWVVNFQHRLEVGSEYLSLPPNMDLTVAVGKFHLGAHINECFTRFSLNFIRGSAINDGEVLERLWNPLNKAATNTRGMSDSLRMRTCDWHMNESNWKKILGTCMYYFACWVSSY
jgi:hypothetical protein